MSKSIFSRSGRLTGALLLAFGIGSNLTAQTWEDISANVPGGMSEEQFSTMDSDGTRLYVLGDKGVFVSADNGDSFTVINDVSGGGPDLGEMSLRFVKFVNGELWVSGSGVTDTPGVLGPRLHRLVPGETVWRPSSGGYPVGIGEGVADDIAYDPVSSAYFITLSTGQIYASSDGGETWEQRTNGLGGIGSPSSVVPAGGGVFTSRPLAGVLKTTDQGLNWSGSQSFGQDSIGNMIAQNGRLLITAGRTTHFSDDAGDSWFAVPNVPHGNSVLSGDGANVFALSRDFTAQEVIAYSASGGLTWHLLPRDGLPPIPTFAGYNVQYLFRHGDFLFLRGKTLDNSFQLESTQLHRLDVSAFNFLNELAIAVQPVGRGLLVGQSHRLEVHAGGANLSYQWQKDGEDLNDETGRVLELDDVQLEDTGDYTVVVRSEEDELVSAVATVTVLERADGGWDPTFDQTDVGDGGKVHLRPDGGAIVVRSGATPLRIYSIGPDGGRLDSYSENTSSANDLSNSFIDQDGRIVIGYKNSSSSTVVRRYESDDFDFIGTLVLGPSGTTERVRDMIEIPGKGYLIVGVFSTAGGVERKNIALVGYDNVVDPDFPEGSGPDSTLESVALAADGNIYTVGLSLSAWDGVSIGRMARISPEGEVSGVTTGLPTGYFTHVYALQDGRLLVRYVSGGEPYLYALSSDGSWDTDFNTANHTISDIRDVAQQADGKIIIVGNFDEFGGVEADGYVRLNLDGTVDQGFFSASGFSHGVIDNVTYDPRGYLYLSSDSGSSSSTFQGFGSVGRGPVRIFATPAATEPGGDTFADWPALSTLPVDQRGPDATPADDGVKNIVKYALGVLPLDSAAARLPVETVVDDGGQTYPAVTFVRSQSAAGTTIVVDVASTVEFGDDLGSTAGNVEDLGDGTERVTIRSNTSAAVQGLQFFRINVTQP